MESINRVSTFTMDEGIERIDEVVAKIRSILSHPPYNVSRLLRSRSFYNNVIIKFNKPVQLNCLINIDNVLGHYRIYVRNEPFIIKKFIVHIIDYGVAAVDLILDNPTIRRENFYYLEFFEPTTLESSVGMYMFGFPKVLETLERYGYEVVRKEGDRGEEELFKSFIDTIIDMSKEIYRIVDKKHVWEIAVDPNITVTNLVIDIVRKTRATLDGKNATN